MISEEEEEPKDDVFTKKAKVADEKSVEEERLEKLEKNEGDEKEEKEASGGVNLGPITFTNFFMLGLRISMLARMSTRCCWNCSRMEDVWCLCH